MAFAFDARSGKGGHGVVSIGERFTTVQTELTEGRIESIRKQLGLPKDCLKR